MMKLFVALSLLLATATHARAQEVSGWFSPAQCAELANAVRGKRLFAPDDTANFAWLKLPGCVDAPKVAADVIRTPVVKRETDPERIRQFFALFGSVRSPDLFAAFKAVVDDGDSSTPMKLASLRALGSMRLPRMEWYSGGVAQLTSQYCSRRFRSTVEKGSEDALPRNYVGELIEFMSAQEKRASNDIQVRVQAHCWRIALEQTLPPDSRKIALKHLCGSRFRVTNGNSVDVMTNYDVEGTTEHGNLIVPPNGSSRLVVFADGNVRLFFAGTLIDHSKTSKDDCSKKKP